MTTRSLESKPSLTCGGSPVLLVMYATIFTCTGSASQSCRNLNALEGRGLGCFRNNVRSLLGHSTKPKPFPRGLNGRMIQNNRSDAILSRGIANTQIASTVGINTSSTRAPSARVLRTPRLDIREIMRSNHCNMMVPGVSRPLTSSSHLSETATFVSTSNNTSTVPG